MAEVIQNTTSPTRSATGDWWGNIGAAFGSTINNLSDLFYQKELAKAHASIAASTARAHQHLAAAQQQAGSTTTASTATSNNASGVTGAQAGFFIPTWAKWAAGGVLALVGLKAFKVI